MRHITTETQNEIFAFDSMTEIVEYTNGIHFKSRSAGFVGEQGLESWAAVEKRSTRVWAEGISIMEDFVRKLSEETIPELKDHQRRTRFSSDEGDEVDLDRLRAGQDFWRVSTREETSGPTEVTIITDTTTSANKDPKDILWRGAAAIALTKLLEAKGYRVELWVVNGSQLYSGKRRGVMTACCLKQCSDPLDTSTLINTVAGWFYRTATFTLLRTICENQGERVAMGFGTCYSPRPSDLNEVNHDTNRIYSSGVYSFNGALSMIRAELEKIAGPTE